MTKNLNLRNKQKIYFLILEGGGGGGGGGKEGGGIEMGEEGVNSMRKVLPIYNHIYNFEFLMPMVH